MIVTEHLKEGDLIHLNHDGRNYQHLLLKRLTSKEWVMYDIATQLRFSMNLGSMNSGYQVVNSQERSLAELLFG